MAVIIKAIGIFIAAMGLVFLLKPGLQRTLTRFFAADGRLYLVAVVRFALAVIFLLGAKECHSTRIIAAFGIIFLLSGLLIFILGLEKARSILSWYLEQPVFIFRIIATVVLIVGLVIVFSA
jgi:uncharacterized protein YjeT (DUF2065 family)